jgi:hypothetical protein
VKRIRSSDALPIAGVCPVLGFDVLAFERVFNGLFCCPDSTSRDDVLFAVAEVLTRPGVGLLHELGSASGSARHSRGDEG